MKTRKTSVVISFLFGLGVAACHGPTGMRGASDAGQGGSAGDLGTGGIATGGIIGSGGTGGVPTGGIAMGGSVGGGGTGGVPTGGIASGGIIGGGGTGGVPTGGIASGGIIGGGGSGGVPTGGMVMGGVTGSGGGAVDAGSDGSMCNGQPLPAGALPVCIPMAAMAVCISCEGPQHPECAAVCINRGCSECGSSGWVHSRVDCCRADGGIDRAGGAISTGGVPAADGATETSAMTLAEACTKNCALASGLAGCSTTETVCEQNCMTTYDNTYAVQPYLGSQYTAMMICIATNFTSSADFVCAKPNSPLNKWSPVVDSATDSPCKQQICEWNCDDATHGDMDPWVDLYCACGL